MNVKIFSVKDINFRIVSATIVYFYECEIKYEYFCVIALACIITAGAIFILTTNSVCTFIKCRSPPIKSKFFVLNWLEDFYGYKHIWGWYCIC